MTKYLFLICINPKLVKYIIWGKKKLSLNTNIMH